MKNFNTYLKFNGCNNNSTLSAIFRKVLIVFFLAFAFLLFAYKNLQATTYYSRASANWNVASTWSTVSCGGAAAAAYPIAGDIVNICSGNTITVTATAACASITFTGGQISIGTTNALTVSGNITFSSGGTLAFGGSGTLNIGGNLGSGATAFTCSTGTVNFSTLAGGQSIAGYTYYNLTLSNTSGTNTAAGNISIATTSTLTTTSGGTLDMGTYQLIGASLIPVNNGTITTACLATPPQYPIPTGLSWGGTINYYAATGGQTIMPGTYGTLLLSNTSGTNTAYGTITVNTALTTAAGGTLDMSTYQLSGAFTPNNNGTLMTSDYFDTYPIPDLDTWSGTVHYVAPAYLDSPDISGGTYNNLTLSNLGTGDYCYAYDDITVNGTFTTNTGDTLDLEGYQLTGTISSLVNNGTIETACTTNPAIPTGYSWGGGVIFYWITGAQTIPTSSTFNNLDIENTSGVTLASNVTVSGTLILTQGNITTGTYTLFVSNSATNAVSYNSITGGQVVGNLQRAIATGTNTYRFDVGTSSSYNPVSVNFTSVTTGGNLTAYVTSGQNPNFSGIPVNTTKDVSLYWTLTNGGVACTSYAPTFNYYSSNIIGAATQSNFIVGEYSSSVWTIHTPVTNAGSGTTSVPYTSQVTGLTTYGDFVVGIETSNTVPSDYFRSKATGSWSNISTWQSSHDDATWINATLAPTNAATLITIQSPNTVTVDLNNQTASNLVIASGGTLINSGTNNFEVNGNWTNNSGTFIPNAGTVTFNGTIQTLGGTGTTTFNNVTLSGTASVTTGNGVTISNNLSIGDGTTFTAGGYALTVTGTTTIGSGTSGNLTISSATGTKTFTGLVTINSGGTWNNSGNSGVTFQDGITNYGTFTAGTGVYTFNTNPQTLTGTFSIPSVTVTGVTLTNLNSLTVGTALSGTGTLSQAASSTLNIGGTSGISALTATTSGNTVNYTGAAQTINSTNYYNLTLSGSGTDVLQAGTTAIGGNLTVSGSVTTTTAANLAITGNLSTGDGTTLTIGAYTLSVGGTTTVGGGTSGTLSFSSATNPSMTFTGLVTINNGASWTESAAITPSFSNGITLNGTGTYTAGSGVHTFNNNSQQLTGTFTIPNVIVTGITLTNNGTLTVGTALSGSGNLTQAPSATLNIGGTSGITTISATNGGNTVVFDGASQTVPAFDYYNLNLSSAATAITLAGSGTIGIAGTFTVPGAITQTVTGSTVVFNGTGSQTIPAFNYYNLTSSSSGTRTLASSGTIGVAETFTTGTNTYTVTGSTMAFNGTAAQSIPVFTFNSLTINNSSGVTLSSNTTLGSSGILTLTSGIINTSGYTLIITNSATGAVSYTSGQVAGFLQRAIATGSNTYSFDVGTLSYYTPVSIAFTGVSSSGNITASITTGQETNSPIPVDPSYDVTQYWTLTNSGVTCTSYAPTFTYNSANFTGTQSSFIVGNYSSGWTTPTPVTNGGSGPYTSGVTGITAYGDFVIGQPFASTPGDYFRSVVTGNWSTPSKWQSSHDDGIWGIATSAPTNSAALITIQNGTNIAIDNSTQTASTIIINSGGTLTNNTTNTIQVSGNWTNNGGTFTPNSGLVNFNGSGAQSINGSSNTPFNNLSLSGSGAITMTSVTTIAGNLNISGTATMTGNEAFSIGGAFNYSSSGSSTLTATDAISMGTFNQTAGTLTDNGVTLTVTGTGPSTWTETGTFTATGNVIFTGSAPQIGATNFNSLQINTGTSATLTGNVSLNGTGTLTFTSGNLIIGNYNLTLNAGAGIGGTPSVTSMVVTNGTGQLIYGINTGSSTIIFPIGDATNYTPVTLAFSSNSAAGTVGINTINSTETNMDNPSTPGLYLTRYWTFSNTGLTNYNYTGTFTYPTANLSNSLVETYLKLSSWSGSAWTEYDSQSSAASNVLTITSSLDQSTGALTGDFTGRTETLPCVVLVPTMTAKANGNAVTTTICKGGSGFAYLTANATNEIGCTGTSEFAWSDGNNYWDGTGFNSATAIFNSGYTGLVTGASVNTTYTVTGRCSGYPSCTSNSVVSVVVNDPAAITYSPSNATIKSGGNTSFSVIATGTGYTYQWQVQTHGTGAFSNLTDGGSGPDYSGSTTETLILNGVVIGNSTNKYQCIVYASSPCTGSATSLAATLTVNPSPTSGLWDGTSSTDWNTGSNWDDGNVPVSTTPVIIPSSASYQPIISSSESGICSSISIYARASLTVNGTLTCEGNLLILSDTTGTGAFTQSDGAVVTTGSATVQRHLQNLGYHYIASPLTGVACNGISGFSISAYNTGVYYNPDNPAPANKFPNMWRLDEAHTHYIPLPAGQAQDDQNAWYAPSSSETMTPGLGYAINTGGGIISVSKTGSSLNAGNITAGVFKEAASTDTGVNGLCLDATGVTNGNYNGWGCSTVSTGPTNGFHLIANPYPSPVDWQALVNGGGVGTNIGYGISFFKATSQFFGVYGTYFYNGFFALTSGAFPPSRYIPTMQSFFIQNNVVSTPVLTFTNAYRTVTNDALNANFYKTEEVVNGYPVISLSGYKNEDKLISDKTVIIFQTQEADFGSGKLMNTDDNVPNIYSVSQQQTTNREALSIQGISKLKDDLVIPLGFDVNSSGTYTITATEILNFPSATHIFLQDLKNNVSQELNINPTYSFEINKGDAENRFFLSFGNSLQTSTINTEMFDAYGNDNILVVNFNNPSNSQATLSILNMLGQNVNDNIVLNSGTYRLGLGVAPGAYIVRLITKDKVNIKKVYLQ